MSTYFITGNGSDSTGDGSAARPFRTYNGLWNAGRQLVANDVILLGAGGIYDKLNIGFCPHGLTIDKTGVGPDPITAGIYAYGGYVAPQNVKIRNLKVVPQSGNAAVGLNINNGFINLLLENIEVSGFDCNISLISADGSFSTNTTVRHVYTHHAGSVGLIIGNSNGVLFENCVADYCGWLPNGRPPNQCHNFYIQHLSCTNVTINNCFNSRARMNGFRGCGTYINNCLGIDNGNSFAGEDILRRMVYCFAIGSHDPDASQGMLFGAFANFDHCNGTLIANCLAAGGKSTGNSHALSFGGCSNCTIKNFVTYDWAGDCLSFDFEPTSGNKFVNVRLHQPSASQNFVNGGVPIPTTWGQTSVLMDRNVIADNRATIEAILTHVGVADLGALANWLYADASRLKPLMDWIGYPYMNLLMTDMNGDGVKNVLDYNAFLNLFAAQDPRADVNNDGQYNVLDFNAFLNSMAE